ncbi:MAG TPA: DUF5606 domain-containing protein [Flavisolibacter sp.]|nr:DUF5606 domain-containing protein [Flavisolibacter sp.]
MDYKRIVAVTGLSGLFEVVSSKTDGALLRSLEDGTTKFVSSRVHNLSHLESIEIFTEDENVNLAEVFEAMKSTGDALPDVKDNKALKAYFEKVYPKMDFERVYTSDMKKMVKWYEVLNEKGIEIKLSNSEDAEETLTEENVSPEAEAIEAPAQIAEADTTEMPVPEGNGAKAEKPVKAVRNKKSEQ